MGKNKRYREKMILTGIKNNDKKRLRGEEDPNPPRKRPRVASIDIHQRFNEVFPNDNDYYMNQDIVDLTIDIENNFFNIIDLVKLMMLLNQKLKHDKQYNIKVANLINAVISNIINHFSCNYDKLDPLLFNSCLDVAFLFSNLCSLQTHLKKHHHKLLPNSVIENIIHVLYFHIKNELSQTRPNFYNLHKSYYQFFYSLNSIYSNHLISSIENLDLTYILPIFTFIIEKNYYLINKQSQKKNCFLYAITTLAQTISLTTANDAAIVSFFGAQTFPLANFIKKAFEIIPKKDKLNLTFINSIKILISNIQSKIALRKTALTFLGIYVDFYNLKKMTASNQNTNVLLSLKQEIKDLYKSFSEQEILTYHDVLTEWDLQEKLDKFYDEQATTSTALKSWSPKGSSGNATASSSNPSSFWRNLSEEECHAHIDKIISDIRDDVTRKQQGNASSNM
jgi:hypothetical protein